MTSTQNSGPYIVADGNTYYKNRVYLSMQTVYASNSCGYVGKQYAGTTLTLKSSDIYSVHGYHHEFEDVGFPFDFEDLSHVPVNDYYANCGGGQDPICIYSGSQYHYGRDFINGANNIDFGVAHAVDDGYTGREHQWIWQGAYSPTLLVPLQIRTLDPAWSTCDLNLVGLYDPPKTLTGELTYATPTMPTVPQTTAATPEATVTGDRPTATTEPESTDAESSIAYDPTGAFTYDPLPTDTSDTSQESQASDKDPVSEGDPEPVPDATDTTPTSTADLAQPSEGEAVDHTESPPDTSPIDQAPSSVSRGDDGVRPIETIGPDPTTRPAAQQPYSSGTTMVGSQPEPPSGTDHSGSSEKDTGADNSEPEPPNPGGIIASIIGGLLPPPPTTNALSVLESAAQTLKSYIPTAEPDSQQPESTAEAEDPYVESTAKPGHQDSITLPVGGETRTLEPIAEGLYTIDSPDTTFVPTQRPTTDTGHPAFAPITFVTNGQTQTMQPVEGSSGLYSEVLPNQPESAPGNEHTATTTPSNLAGTATFVADGHTYTMQPIASSSGVYVIDGSRTLTQLGPEGSAAPRTSQADGLASDQQASSPGASQASGAITGSDGLPDIVTASASRSPPARSSSRAADGDVSMLRPTDSAAASSRTRSGWWLFVSITAVQIWLLIP